MLRARRGRARGARARPGPDVYGLTAVTAVHGALLLADEAMAGAHAPASAFDAAAFLEHLAPFGVRYEVSGPAS